MANWQSTARTTEEESDTSTATDGVAPQGTDTRWGNAAAAEDFGIDGSPDAPTNRPPPSGAAPGWASDEGVDEEPVSPAKLEALARHDEYIRASIVELLASMQAEYAARVKSQVAALLADPSSRLGGGRIELSILRPRDDQFVSRELSDALGQRQNGTAYLQLDANGITASFSSVSDNTLATTATVVLDGVVWATLMGSAGVNVSWREHVGSDPFTVQVLPGDIVVSEPGRVYLKGA